MQRRGQTPPKPGSRNDLVAYLTAKLREVKNDVGELLGLNCQKALLDSAPFEKWPSDMRRLVGADYRELGLTFFYGTE